MAKIFTLPSNETKESSKYPDNFYLKWLPLYRHITDTSCVYCNEAIFVQKSVNTTYFYQTLIILLSHFLYDKQQDIHIFLLDNTKKIK